MKAPTRSGKAVTFVHDTPFRPALERRAKVCVVSLRELTYETGFVYRDGPSYFCLWKQNGKWSRQGRECWNIVRKESQRDVAIQGGGRTRA